jgi:hypothetical protein
MQRVNFLTVYLLELDRAVCLLRWRKFNLSRCEDEAKCQRLNLEGSISFTSLQSRTAALPKTQEIIFY